MNIVEHYDHLVDSGEYEKAIPVIKEIIRRLPQSSTSWFNYGICLNEVGRWSQAASAFLKAFTLDAEDGGALYRACLALARADEADRLLRVFQNVCTAHPSMIYNFLEEEAFTKFFQLPEFEALKQKYANLS